MHVALYHVAGIEFYSFLVARMHLHAPPVALCHKPKYYEPGLRLHKLAVCVIRGQIIINLYMICVN